jgi:hypothetical protein
MSWHWCFWRHEARVAFRESVLGAKTGEPKDVEDWESRLIDAGVSTEWVARLAEGLESRHGDLGRGSAIALIEGAALAVALQAEAHADVERSLRDVREVERLLGAFSGELEKLDEVLEVLAAYAQRMRAKPASSTRRVLH